MQAGYFITDILKSTFTESDIVNNALRVFEQYLCGLKQTPFMNSITIFLPM